MLRLAQFLLSIGLIAASSAVLTGLAQTTAPTVASTIDAAAAARGTLSSGPILNSKAAGTLTFLSATGERRQFPVEVLRLGNSLVQRVIHQASGDVLQGTDGVQSWHVAGGFRTTVQGATQQFIEAQTVRSLDALFDFRATGLTLRDLGLKATDRVIEAQDPQGRITHYSIDSVTSLLTKLEVVTGQGQDLFGNPTVHTDSYVFSDYRRVDGVATPFKIERYNGNRKVEELQFTSVTYNTNVTSLDFRPTP